MKRVFAHIGFSFAITMIILNLLPIKGAFAVLALAGVLFVAFILIKKTRNAVAVPLCMFSCMLAAVIFISFSYGTFLPQQNSTGKETEIQFYLVDIPEKTDNGYLYTVKTTDVDCDGAPQNIKLSVYSKNRINADYNQIVKAKVRLNPIADNGFNSYGRYADNIFLSAYSYDSIVTDETAVNLLSPVLKLKEAVINYFLENLEGDDAGVAIALVTGCRSYISDETYNVFKSCGIMHLFAVSGLHLSVFAGSLYYILKRLRCPKIPSVIITMIFVILYMAFIGFTPSILRAGFMFILMCTSKLTGKKDDTLNSLGFAVFLICLNPYAVTDAGGMLTVTSVIGLSVIYPKIKVKRTFKYDFSEFIANSLSATVSVIISTMPVMYLFFGYQSLMCIILNIFMIPLVQIYLYLLSFSLNVSFSPFISNLVFYPVKWLSFAIIKIMYAFSKLYFLMLNLDEPVIGALIGGILIFFGITFVIAKNKIKLSAVLSSVIFVAVVLLNVFLSADNTYVKIISGSESAAVVVYDGENAFAAGVNDFKQYSIVKNIVSNRKLTLLMVIDDDGSKYSRMLADEFSAANYIAGYDYSDFDINSENVLSMSEFNIDLWHGFNVQYSYNDDGETIILNVYNFSLAYTDDLINVLPYDTAVYSAAAADCDITYTVSETGYTERRENNWLK